MGPQDLYTPKGYYPDASDARGRPYPVTDIVGHFFVPFPPAFLANLNYYYRFLYIDINIKYMY